MTQTSRREPLVSVVTPVYNGESHLRECIESVLAQTYQNWDYTIVNNCSTDGTLDIAMEYAARDPRIRIHNNDAFVRVTENHNIAFRQVSPASTYCKLVLADDWLFPECLARMVRVAEEHPTVGLVGAYGLVGPRLAWIRLPYPSTVIPGREACRIRLLEGHNFFGTATAVLFRSDIVRKRHAFWNESNLHADSESYLEILAHYDFGFVHQVLTFSREREGSLTAFSHRFNTYLPGNLYELLTFGPNCLTDEELQRKLREHIAQYYEYLGQQIYRRRGSDFWRFHRKKMAELGYPLSSWRLVVAGTSYVLDLALNPKSTVQKVLNRLRRNGAGAGAHANATG